MKSIECKSHQDSYVALESSSHLSFQRILSYLDQALFLEHLPLAVQLHGALGIMVA